MARFIRFHLGSHPTSLDQAVVERLMPIMKTWRLTIPKRSWIPSRPFTIAVGEHARVGDLIVHPLGDIHTEWPNPVGLVWGHETSATKNLLRLPAYAPKEMGLDENVFAITRELRLSERPRILYLGSFQDGAGLTAFLGAMKDLLTVQGEAILIGGIAVRDRLAPVVARLGLAQQVIFAPPLSPGQLSGLYHSADVLVYPDRDPGQLYQLIDVYAHGLPVVLRDTPETRKIWGYPALLVSSDDGNQWGEAIQEVIDNTRLREVLIRRGMEFAQMHETEIVITGWRSTIEKISGQSVVLESN
ncbi:glycosyltransferase [Sulfobacillus thermosulfidooxidans]|uniref:glycosyltransferase n=1 Tax=Sulfobacillus thermosulfidooxidans TaxID=28034 RepID=UPI0006B48C7A|nr:glycosyltransferase [Sulfobacillus thermosulfidooxidans]